MKNLLPTGEQIEILITGKTTNNKLFIGKDYIKVREKKVLRTDFAWQQPSRSVGVRAGLSVQLASPFFCQTVTAQ
ncbi:MAG: hypothetical protein ABH986_04920 [archaeon]